MIRLRTAKYNNLDRNWELRSRHIRRNQHLNIRMKPITLIFSFVTLLLLVTLGFTSAFLHNEGSQEVKFKEVRSLDQFWYLLADNVGTFTVNIVTIIVY